MTAQTQTAPRDPLFPFLAASADINAAEQQQRTADALYIAAYNCCADAANRVGPFARHNLAQIAGSIAVTGDPFSRQTFNSPAHPNWRAAHDYAMLQSETDDNPIRAQVWRFIRAQCWRKATAGHHPSDRAAAQSTWQTTLDQLSSMERP